MLVRASVHGRGRPRKGAGFRSRVCGNYRHRHRAFCSAFADVSWKASFPGAKASSALAGGGRVFRAPPAHLKAGQTPSVTIWNLRIENHGAQCQPPTFYFCGRREGRLPSRTSIFEIEDVTPRGAHLGEFRVLLGPSGCASRHLPRLIAGLDRTGRRRGSGQ